MSEPLLTTPLDKAHWIDYRQQQLVEEIRRLADTMDQLRLEMGSAFPQNQVGKISDAAHRIARVCGAIQGKAHEHKAVEWVGRHPKFTRDMTPAKMEEIAAAVEELAEGLRHANNSRVQAALVKLKAISK